MSGSFRLLAGRHRILGLLGAGGMGSVFSRHLELDQLVAVKMLHKALASSDSPTHSQVLDRFRSEVRLARRVTHKNVARTYDIGEHEGERFLTMEYINGESLGALLDRVGSLDISTFFHVAEAIVAGLAAAHEAGVVHRDLKPGNVLIEGARAGRVALTDFGIAAPVAAPVDRELSGTPSYMAPEQFSGLADARSDVYALGLVLYRALTGRRAFRSNHPLTREAHTPIALTSRSDLPAGLSALIAKCLELAPENRYASAIEVCAALAPILASVSQRSPSPNFAPTTHRVLRDVRRDPRIIFVGATTEDARATGLRDAIVDVLNEHAIVRATRDETAPHEVRAFLDLPDDGTQKLTVRLVGAREDFEFWSDTFAFVSGEILSIARTAAEEIVRALAISVSSIKQRDVPPFGSSAAELLYVTGRSHLRAFWPVHLRLAAASFSSALDLRPGHPLLLAALATTHARQLFFSDCSEADARAAAVNALHVAPNLAEAHVAMAVVHLQNNDTNAALAEILRALDLAPGLAEAHETLARILLEAGAASPAIRAAEIAQMRDPSLGGPRFEIARAHALFGRWDLCTEILGAVAAGAAETSDSVTAIHQLRFASWRRDVTTLETILKLPRGKTEQAHTFYDLYAATLAGDHADVRAVEAAHKLQPVESSLRLRSFVNQIGAELRAFVGDSRGAIASLERAVEVGLADALWCDRCPLFDDLRGDVRFESLRETVHARAKEVLLRFEAASIVPRPVSAS